MTPRPIRLIVRTSGPAGPVDPEPPVGSSLFPGHIPFRVYMGTNSPTSGRPNRSEAEGISGISYTHRMFESGDWTVSGVTSNQNYADNNNEYGVVSGKVPGNDWTMVANGGWDSRLTQIRDYYKARRAAGDPKSLAALHHEPDGDGDLAEWGRMQVYVSNFFAGWTTNSNGTKGTYTAANDVSDQVGWAIIPNGHWWGLRFPKPDRIAAACPPLLYKTIQENGGVIMPDFYDANPPNGDRENPGGYAANADRASRQMTGFLQWVRNHQATYGKVGVGCGEFGTTEDTEMQRVFDLVFANRDIWALLLYFNNFANSRWDWRLIPANYPAGLNPTNSKGLTDLGGSGPSQRKLDLWKQMRDLSVTSAYTSPIGG